jgi:hypothetical protein
LCAETQLLKKYLIFIQGQGYFLPVSVLTFKSFVNKTKNGTMKKLLLVLAIAAFVACNDSGNAEETTSPDSPAAPAPVTPAPDTATVQPDTAAKTDTSVKK